MEIHAYANHYLGSGMFVVWSDPGLRMNSFEIFRDGERIAYSENEKQTKEMFVHPEMFDNDHSTNLFRKDSPYKFIFNDKTALLFRHYTYEVIGRYIEDDGTILAIETSGKAVVYYD